MEYDRAMVVKCEDDRNKMKVVLVLERADLTDAPAGSEEDRFGVTWVRGSTGETIWIVKSLGDPFYFSTDGAVVRTNIAYFTDSQLMPLPDEEDCQEELKVEAKWTPFKPAYDETTEFLKRFQK